MRAGISSGLTARALRPALARSRGVKRPTLLHMHSEMIQGRDTKESERCRYSSRFLHPTGKVAIGMMLYSSKLKHPRLVQLVKSDKSVLRAGALERPVKNGP